MRYGEKRMALKDGQICLLRSPGAEDAGAMLDYLRDIAGETHFLIRYPEEVGMDPAEEADFLEQQRRPDSRRRDDCRVYGRRSGRGCQRKSGRRAAEAAAPGVSGHCRAGSPAGASAWGGS